MSDMYRLAWPLAYVLIGVLMYSLSKRYSEGIERMLDNRFSTVSFGRGHGEEVGEVVTVLRYDESQVKRVFAVVLFFVGWGMLISVLLARAPQITAQEWQTNWAENAALIGFFYIMFGAGPWLLFFYYRGEMRVITRTGILKLAFFSRRFFVHWDEIRSVRLVTGKGSTFMVKTAKGAFGVPLSYGNIGEFAEAIMHNVPASKWVKASASLRHAVDGQLSPLDRWT
jgi:hypothetical protein